MKTAERFLVTVLEGFIALCFVAMFAIVVTLVVLRYVFNESITGANELITVLFVYTTSIGGALAAGKGEHIAIPFAVESLSGRAQRWAGRLSFLAVAFINGSIAWLSMRWIAITGDYLMPTTGLPRVVAQMSIPAGCGIAAIYCLLKAMAPEDGESR